MSLAVHVPFLCLGNPLTHRQAEPLTLVVAAEVGQPHSQLGHSLVFAAGSTSPCIQKEWEPM